MNEWLYYNDNEYKAGVQARYRINGDVLQVEIEGTNSRLDWIGHFLGFYKSRRNRIWWSQAGRLAGVLKKYMRDHPEIENMELRGHSYGGAIAAIIARYNSTTVQAKIYGAPKTGILASNITAYYHRGDMIRLLPPWLPGYKNKEFHGRFSFDWYKNHNSYSWRF